MPINDYPIFPKTTIEGFKESFDSLQRLDDKFDFMCSYLLSHGMGDEEPECDFDELLHYAKKEFIDASLALKEEYAKHHPSAKLNPEELNPYGGSKENEAMQQYFLANPTDFLAKMGQSYYENAKEDPAFSEQEKATFQEWKDNCRRLGQELGSHKTVFEDYEADLVPDAVITNASMRLYGRDDVGVEEFLDRNKGGLFERKFGSTSPEYKNFEASFRDYNNVDSPRFGDSAAVKANALAYIRHKFPGLKEGELPTQEQISAIKNSTSKGRIEFTVSIVKEIALQERYKEISDACSKAVLGSVDAEQENFQQGLAEDIKESDGVEAIDIDEVNEAQAEVAMQQ